MNRDYFKQIFGKYSGYVYRLAGPVPEGLSHQDYILEKFTHGTSGGEVFIVQLPNAEWLIHSQNDNEIENFQLLADLSFQPPLEESISEEQPPLEESISEEQPPLEESIPEEQGDQNVS
jgi:hypothetical protein